MGEGKKYVICEKELEVYRRDMLENERSRAAIGNIGRPFDGGIEQRRSTGCACWSGWNFW